MLKRNWVEKSSWSRHKSSQHGSSLVPKTMKQERLVGRKESGTMLLAWSATAWNWLWFRSIHCLEIQQGYETITTLSTFHQRHIQKINKGRQWWKQHARYIEYTHHQAFLCCLWTFIHSTLSQNRHVWSALCQCFSNQSILGVTQSWIYPISAGCCLCKRAICTKSQLHHWSLVFIAMSQSRRHIFCWIPWQDPKAFWRCQELYHFTARERSTQSIVEPRIEIMVCWFLIMKDNGLFRYIL